jgi:hypothetical protein
MKWVFTLIALLLFVECFSLYHFMNIQKQQVVQVAYDHNDEENSGENRVEVREVDKTTPDHNSFTHAPIVFQKGIAYSRYITMYISGFIADLCQPPRIVPITCAGYSNPYARP